MRALRRAALLASGAGLRPLLTRLLLAGLAALLRLRIARLRTLPALPAAIGLPAALAGLGLLAGRSLIEGLALLLQDFLEALFDVVEGRGEVEPVERLAALLAELLEKVAQALGAVADRVAHAALQEVAQRVLQVA